MLVITLFSSLTVPVQATGTLALTVTASSSQIDIGDEVTFTISIGDATGTDLSAFSFRIRISDGLELKTGTCYMALNFRETSGMFMTAFDEKPSLMVSGFGGAGYNSGVLDIAMFTCTAKTVGTLKAELYDVQFYSLNNTQITTSAIFATITVTQKSSDGNDSGQSQNDNADFGNNDLSGSQNENNNSENSNTGNNEQEASQNDNPNPENNNGLSEPTLKPSEWINPFSDVKRADWFYDYLASVHMKGLMVGTSQTTFDPNIPVTRAMFARILANLDKIDLSTDTGSRFSDVPAGQWYTSAVEWAADMGIVAGIGNNMFDPNANITREQMAVMLNNYVKYKGISFPVSQPSSAFADEKDISSWAIEAVKAIQSAGIVSGKPGNLYDPKTSATRAEVATIFTRFLESIEK